MASNFDYMTLEEQELLLQEAALVYYVDEETGDEEYVHDERDEGEADDDEGRSYEEETRVAKELEEIFAPRFTESQWTVCEQDVYPIEIENVKKHDRKIKWKNPKRVLVGIKSVADVRLPFYFSRRYPGSFSTNEAGEKIYVLDESAYQSTICFDSAVKSVNKDCISFKTTGKCRFMNRCVYNHNVTDVKKTPKKVTPKKVTDVKKTPEKVTPVKQTPKKVTDVKKTPEKVTPVKQTPAKQTPAKQIPVKQTPAKQTPITKKIFMCKNIIKNQECKFGDRCMFSHSREELEFHMKPCHRGTDCKSVVKHDICMVRNGALIKIVTYENNGAARCPTIHPQELTANYIKRLALVN